MRIAHTVEFFHPRIGGAERVVQEISTRLAARGHDVTVLTSIVAGTSEDEAFDGVRIRRFDVRGNGVTGIAGRVDDFREELLGGGYEVVLNYACQAWPTDLTFRWLDELDAATVLAPCGYSGLTGGWLKRFVYRRYFATLPDVLRKYDRIVYHSPDYIDAQLGVGWGLGNGAVVPNGVNLSEARALPRVSTLPEVLSIGNHYRVKNHKDFFRLAERLRGRARFRLVATPERHRFGCIRSCRSRAKETGVTLSDGRDRTAVLNAIARSTVLVITSRLECSPLTVLEGLAAGVPFVSYDVGCVRDHPGGLVVDSLDELSDAVAMLVQDESLRDRLAEAGRRYVSELDWELVSERYEALYLDALATRAPVGLRS